MKKILLFLTFLSIATFGVSQQLVVQNAQEIDANRYKDIKGTPYFFKGWATATLVGTKGEKTENIKINYNGFEGEWEVMVDGKHITLETSSYKEIQLTPPDSKEQWVFKRGLHAQYANKFPQLIYNGANFKLIKDFRITKSKQKIENVGKTIVVERFWPQRNYWMIRDNEITAFKMKKKEVIKQLGGSSSISSFMKKEKIDLGKVADVQKLLTYYETL